MIPSKNNDIGHLVELFRQRDVTNRERKGILQSIEAILEKLPDIEALNVKWIYLLDNNVWTVFSKFDRTDLKNLAGKILRRVGILLFDSTYYPEFLIWLGTLHQNASKRHDDGRADIVFSVCHIIESISSKTENRLVPTDDEYIRKSAEWLVRVAPNAKIGEYNHCLNGFILISEKFPKIADDMHEPILRAILSNLPDFNSHERNWERLIDTVCMFSGSFSKNPEFAAEMVRLVRPDMKRVGIRNLRELKRRMKLLMAIVKMAKSQKILEETNQLMSELRSNFEGKDGKWSSATLITIICDLLNELLILGKDDEKMRKSVEESLGQLLKDLNLSKQNTKEKQAFFNSLAKIIKQLPTESDVKTQIHHIVFNQETGLFSAQNSDNRIFGHNTLYKDLVNLISVLLTPTSLNHLQATYTDLRKIMMESMTRLKQSVENPESDNVRWHESILLLFFSALQAISCAKSSLIVMMGIRPSIFELFTGELPLTEYWLASNHPQVYHLFVTILVGHLKAHDFYVAQSDYLVRGENSMQTIGQTKREYARKQVLALQKIISTFGNRLWKKTRLLISSWLHSLVSTALDQKMRAECFRQKEWFRLRNTVIHHSMLDWNNESINQTLTLLSPITIWPALSADANKDLTDKTKKATWKEATVIWEAGDFKTYIRQSMSTVYQIGQERQQKLIVATSFGAEEFNVVTNFLLKQVVPTTFKKGPYVWMDEVLENLTQGCQNISQDKTEIPEAFIDKWDWIISQTANFCIINKMKTPLGKPMQTFAAFENEIKRLAKEVINRKNSEKKVKPTEESSSTPPPLKYSVQWLRVHLLLKLIEVLEKLMMSAIYGGSSIFNLTEIPVTARQFFVMNSSSCEVWLNRVYFPALIVAYFNGNYGLVIRFGSNALNHYARQKSTDDKMVVNGVCAACLMSLSMAILGEPMEIVGLRRKVREEFGTEMGQQLMEALGEMAQAKYEIALVSMETILVADSNLNETLRLIIQIAMTDMLNRIRLPEAVSYYKKTLFGEEDAQVAEDFRSVEMLTKFEKLNNRQTDKRQVVDWSARERLQLVEAAYSQTMKRNELLDLQKEMSAMGSLALSADSSCKLYSDISSTSLVIANLVDRMTGNTLWKNNMTELEMFDKSEEGNGGDKLAICRKLMHWGRHMKHQRGQSYAAHGEIIRLSRKTSNSMLAFFHINSAIRNDKLNAWQRLEVERQRLKLAKGQDVNVRIQEMNAVFGSLADVFVSSVQLKQSFQMQDIPTQNQMVFEGYMTEISKREEHMSRASIQLGDFFQTLPSIDNVLTSNLIDTMIWSEIETRSGALNCGVSGLIGALFNLATEMCPTLAKAHLKMAKWAYEMAKIDNFPNAGLFSVYTYGHSEQEKEELWKCLEATSVGNLEKQVRKAIPDGMRANSLISPHSPFLLLWEAASSHRRKFLSIAVSSYFQFIHNMSGEFENLPYSKREETTLATLRILELLVKHGEVLIDVINEGLNRTNVHVWKEILPQLFARLSHPSEHIRQTLVDLISRVCTAAPHAVVFQVVSGAASYSEVGEDLEEQQNDDRNQVRACCEQLETKMAQSYPSLVRDVRQFVAELERINLLNEEKWSVVLGTMEHEMEKRLVLIRAENTKTEMSMHLIPTMKDEIISKKTKLLTRQIFDVLDELYEQTILEPPKTKNEEEFVTAFSEILTNAHNESKKARWVSPESSWAPFKNLIASFVHRNIKKGMHQLNTADISPYLATLGKSCVPMPGQESVEFDRVVSIARVTDQVTILPTKTRPKKLGFIGSDGKQVAFLFKGREDLHLDERVMQFLRLCNVMLQPGKGKTRQFAEYQAHHYAVIPLGPRSGLIKWVEGATPMFHIYRRWQVKEKALKTATKKNGETVPEIERPTNMYHNMIRQAFAAHNIDSIVAADRSKWPVHVLEEVFDGLCSKTPTDLISRELWMRANNATAWWAVTKRYARSLAVMSMVGSVLGLGDRHLDNLLVDLKYGHVVHIDYNICFDKGKNLRIPETVPFRLSRNMRHALGPSEMYGTFRESCVHVLSTLRNGHQVLTMLLDAFVFDPLVDWTSHELISTSGGVSLALQLAVYGSNWKAKARDRLTDTIELFQLRVNELHALWMNNREDLLHWMKQVTDCLLIQNSLLGLNGLNEQQKVKAGTELREAITRHQALAKELRPLIRAIGKDREEFAEFLKFYKQAFIEPLLKGHSALRHNVDIETSVHNFNIVMQNIDLVFMSLINLSTLPIDSISARTPQQELAPPGLENVWVWKQDQQENSQAREVVRRVERRLNGWLDGSTAPDRKLSPREEADVLIAEATLNSNLAQMYEGWTAWV